ncbi:MAG: hypothetical protein ACI4RD_09265 [Kiritimatiellia bacterium]
MMRRLRAGGLATLALLLTGSARAAFDSAEWHGKRELFAREAERMMAVYSNCVRRVDAPAENVTIPVETYEDGSVKVLVSAERAQYFLQEGLVWAEGVAVRKLGRDGAEEGRIDARNCVIDRNARSGWIEGPARVRRGKLECRGKNVYFSAAESYVRVFEQSEVESADLKFGGLAE